jgi:lactoylglutathione lyase
MPIHNKSPLVAVALALGTSGAPAAEPPAAFSFTSMRLLVCDFEASRHFYEDLLRLPVEFKADRYMEFRTADGATLGIFAKPLMPGIKNDCPRDAEARNNDTVLVMRVVGVDRMAKYLETQRVPQVLPPQDRPDWGVRTAHFLDPSGNLLELLESLAVTPPTSE